jgi:hypothetical protein
VPLAFVPALAATIGIQQTLIAGGVLVAVAALGSLGTAAALDRSRAANGHVPAAAESETA